MHTTKVGDIEIFYHKMGEGDPIVLLHGWGGSSKSLLKLGSVLVQHGFTVFIPDLPGFGKSKAPKGDFTLDHYASVIEDMLEKLSGKQPILFGHSFGGSVAIKVAVRKRCSIKKLILCNSSGIRLPKGRKQNVLQQISKITKKLFTLPLLRSVYPSIRKAFYYYILRSRDYIDHQEIAGTFQKVVQEDITQHLPEVSVPTLLLWGRRDSSTPLAFGWIMKKSIPQARLKIFDAGHGLPLRDPEVVAKAIVSFVG